MKLNRKGYLTVEIILASTIAFAIAFFLIEITVKLVSKTDDVYHETVIAYDDAIIINNIINTIITASLYIIFGLPYFCLGKTFALFRPMLLVTLLLVLY